MEENTNVPKKRRTRPEKTTKKTSFKSLNKIKLNRKQIITIITVLSIIAIIVVINNYTALGLVLNKNIDNDDVITVELQTSNNTVIPYGNEFLVYNNGTITIYNNYGKNTGEIKLEDTVEAAIATSGKYIQVINKDKSQVYVYKNTYEVARIKIEGQIYSGTINEEGTSVIEYSENGNKTELGVFDNSGDKKYNIKLSNNIVGKYILSDNSKYLAYVDVNVKGISVQTNINYIDLSNISEEKANITTVHTEENSLAYDIYWEGRNIVVRFGETHMMYKTSSGDKKIIPISENQLVYVDGYNKNYSYVAINSDGNSVLKLGKMTSDKVKSVVLEDMPKYFKYQEGIAYVCYAKKIEAYNNFGTKIKNYSSDTVITEPVIFNNGRSVVMALSNKLIVFTI